MSKPLKDLTGKHFGYLTVLKLCKNNKNINCWLCKCICGNEKIITGSSLQCGDTKSLGRFLDFNDAVKDRKEAEEKYYKEYSYDNSIKQSEKNNVNYN